MGRPPPGAAPPPDGSPGPASGPTPLSRDECLALLARATVGRLVFVSEGWPTALPVNFRVDGGDVVLRTAEGAKIFAAAREPRVGFEVDELDRVHRSGWSVVAHGLAEEVTQPAELERLGSLELATWAPGDRHRWLRVRVLQLTGRRLAAAWSYPGPLP